MSPIRILAAGTACALALTLAAPASAATLGERTNGSCLVAFSAKETAFKQSLFDATKSIQTHEAARDTAAAVSAVFPEGKGAPAPVAEVLAKARATAAATEPTTDVTKEDIDLNGYRVEAKTYTAEQLKPAPVTFPLESAEGVDPAALAKLNTAWLATPTGKLQQMQAADDAAKRAASNACATGAKHSDYPKADAAPDRAPGLSGLASSEPSNFDTVMFAVIGVVLALGGILAALPQLGINLPFKLPF